MSEMSNSPTLWQRRIDLLRAECDHSIEPFNVRIQVIEELSGDLYKQAQLDYETEAPSLEQLIELYGSCAGTAVHAMMQEEKTEYAAHS